VFRSIIIIALLCFNLSEFDFTVSVLNFSYAACRMKKNFSIRKFHQGILKKMKLNVGEINIF